MVGRIMIEFMKAFVGVLVKVVQGICILLVLTSLITAVTMLIPSVAVYFGIYSWVAFPVWWYVLYLVSKIGPKEEEEVA